ncbi:ATP-dependent DNA helicase Q5-like isoform X2 [Dendronephthya gigantea]|nr:ATP-dependent DNA helicase Q5-like isoform X2 [Dendronephthya gigantea]
MEGHNKPSVINDCGIIYCHTKENCENMASKLSDSGIKTKAYHAGLNSGLRQSIQQEWMDGVISVIAATVSFGMGVDKSSVRFVVHWKIPQSVERYYQESGRAGRDGKKSYCRLYYSRYEREQILFLLKKDLKKEKRGNKSLKEKNSIQSFKALVEYCEEARCRHAFISKYFGDKKPECNQGCDFCRKPKDVELMIEQLHEGVIANKRHNGYSKTYMCSDYGEGSDDQYGGGKRGPDTKYDHDEAGDPDFEEKCKNNRVKIIEEEFRKRKGVASKKAIDKNDLDNIPGLACKLKNASNLSRIPKLAVKVREFCLQRLEKALVANCEKSNRTTFRVEQLAVNLENEVFLANRSSQMYKLNIQQKVKEINQSTENNEIFSVESDNFKSPVLVHNDSDIEVAQFVKASELLQNTSEDIGPKEPAETRGKEEAIDIEEGSRPAEIMIKDENSESEDIFTIKVGKIEQENEDMETDCKSIVTISCSTIKPLQGSPSGDSPKSSVLQTLKRPSISKDVQKIIAKREKHSPKSEYDIPSLPPLPPLTDSVKTTTAKLDTSDPEPCYILKPKQQSESSTSSSGLQEKNEIFVRTIKQETFESQVTSSSVQLTSSSQLASSCSFQSQVIPETYFPIQSKQPHCSNSLNSDVLPGDIQDSLPVFSNACVSTTANQAATHLVTSSDKFNSSSMPSPYATNVHPRPSAVQTAHAQVIPPQTIPYPYPQCAQPMQGIPSTSMDPRHFYGKIQPTNSSTVTSSSGYFQDKYKLSVPMNGITIPNMQVQPPVSSQCEKPASSSHSITNASKTLTTSETVKRRPRSTATKIAEKSRNNKKDCADIIVKYLTPYYKSGEVESKSLFKSLAKEMTERLVQSMAGVCGDKLKNTARSLVKMYFDEKRRRSSKVK